MPQPDARWNVYPDGSYCRGEHPKHHACTEHLEHLKNPYGAPGDRLWGRETFYAFGRWETRFSEKKKKRDEHHFADLTIECGKSYRYAADESIITETHRNYRQPVDWHKRPSIFMPRAASRILCEIVNVRVERLQDISESDAQAEGVADRAAFFELWDSINAARGYSWESNPWVWVVEYEVAQP